MPLEVQALSRIEIWDDWECNGGSPVTTVADATACTAIENVAGGEQLTLTVSITSPSVPNLVENNILRLRQDDSTYDEWKIIGRRATTESGLHSVTARLFSETDFAKAGLVEQRLSDGTVLFDFQGVGLTPSDQITQFILPLLAAAGMSWVTLGTITPTSPIDVSYQWDSPLAALQRIAEQTTSELQFTRNGTTGYLIEIVTQIGSAATVADIRSKKNLQNLDDDVSTIPQANRVYPKGAATEDESATMARASWQVAAIAGSVLTLADPAGGDGPILFDDQLNSLYLRKVSGALTQVTASSASGQTVTVASAAGVSVGDLIQFRLNSSGDDLTYLDSPIDAAGGLKAGVLELSSIPGTNNVVKNAATQQWPGSSSAPPSSWSVIGSPTITKQTAAPYVASGGTSIKVQTTVAATGVRTAAVPIFPTAERPYVSYYADIWVVSGVATVRVELVFTTPTGDVVSPSVGNIASNSIVGQFESLGVSGENAFVKGATAAYLRVVQNGPGPAEFYVDSAQITETPSQQPFVDGSGGTKLWQAANERLRTNGGALPTYDLTFVDLARLNPAIWGGDCKVVLGGRVRVKEPRLSIAIETRILEVERNYLLPGASRAVLSNKPDDLTGTGSRPKRPPSVPPVTEPTLPGDLPGIDFVNTPVPLYDANGLQRGWILTGAVNVNTGGLVVEVDAGLDIESVLPLGFQVSAAEYRSDTSTNRGFTIELLQDPGDLGVVTLTPRAVHSITGGGGDAGIPYVQSLQRTPVTLLEIQKTGVITIRNLTFTVSPSTAQLHYRFKVGAGAFADWEVPTMVDGRFSRSMDLAGGDINLEYYAVSTTGVAEEVKRQVIDEDDDPEFDVAVLEDPANTLNVTLTPDDEIVRWAVWAINGGTPRDTTTGEPDDLYLKFAGSVNQRHIFFHADNGPWQVVVRGYDINGYYRELVRNITVGGVAATTGVLLSIGVRTVNVAGDDYIELFWTHNDLIDAEDYTVDIDEGLSVIEADRIARLESDDSDTIPRAGGWRRQVTLATPGSAGAVLRTFGYTVFLSDDADVFVAGYYTEITIWVAGAGGTDEGSTPGTTPPTPVGTNAGVAAYSVKMTWIGADAARRIRINWEQTDDGGATWDPVPGAASVLLAAGTAEHTQTGLVATLKVRASLAYETGAGTGPFSATSNEVRVLRPGEADY